MQTIYQQPWKWDAQTTSWVTLEQSMTCVCRCYVVAFLNRTSRFDWSVVRWGSKSKHRKDTCLKESGLRLQILITTLHSIPNKIGRRNFVSSSQSNRHALLIIITYAKEVHFLIQYLHMFHHKIANATLYIFGVNLISWRTWKITKRHPHTLHSHSFLNVGSS